jgi:hypothetical protein
VAGYALVNTDEPSYSGASELLSSFVSGLLFS